MVKRYPLPLSCPSLTPCSSPPTGLASFKRSSYFQVQVRNDETCWLLNGEHLPREHGRRLQPRRPSPSPSGRLCFGAERAAPAASRQITSSVKRLLWRHMPAAIPPRPPSVSECESKQLVGAEARPPHHGSATPRRLGALSSQTLFSHCGNSTGGARKGWKQSCAGSPPAFVRGA